MVHSRSCPAAQNLALIIIKIKVLRSYRITYLRCTGAENTFVVAVGSVGKKVEELVDRRMGAVLQL